MSTVTIENAPKSFEKQFGNRIDFNQFVGIYWDGMDWCQYDEVIPSKDDISVYQGLTDDIETVSGKELLEKLLKT